MTDTSTTQSSPASASDGDDFLKNVLGEFSSAVKTVMSTAKGITGLINSNAGAVSGNMATGDQAFSKESAAAKAEGQGQEEVTQLQGEAAIKKQNDDSVAAQALGTDRDSLIARASGIMNNQKELDSVDEELKQRAGATLLNNPGQWLSNLFVVPTLQEKREAIVSQLGDRQQSLQYAQKTTQEAFALNESLDTAVGTNLIAAQRKVIAAQAEQKSQQAIERAAVFNNSALEAATSMSTAGFDIAFKALNAQEAQFSAAREVAQANYYAAGTPERDQIVELKAEQEQERKIQEAQLKNASVMTNGAIPDNVAGFKASGTKLQQIYSEIMPSLRTAGSIGFDPVDSLTKAKAIGMQPATGGEQITRNFIDQSIGNVINTFQQPGKGINFKQLTPQEQHQYFQNEVEKRFKVAYSDVSAPGTPLSTIPYKAALKLPLVAGTDIGKALIPLSATDARVNGTDLIATAKQLIKEGKLTPEKAIDQITQISSSLQQATNVAASLQKYGFPSLGTDAAPAYNMSVKGADGIRTLDFTNKAQVQNYLIRDINKEKYGDIPGPFEGLPAYVGAH